MTFLKRELCATGLTTELEITEVYYQTKTEFQDVLIAKTKFGRTLLLDGNSQSSEFDEGRYHAALVHPAMFNHSNPRRVLVGGGGEGATVREVLRHPGVEEVVMVDIDRDAVEAFKIHLPSWSAGAFDDSRTRVFHEDIRTWLQRCDPGAFDVVILDLSDPVLDGPSTFTFTEEFYRLCDRAMSPSGVIAGQIGEFDGGASGNYARLFATFGQVFAHRLPYRSMVPFFGCEWGFILASHQRLAATPDNFEARFEKAGGAEWLDYDVGRHQAMMSLSLRERRLIEAENAPVRDASNLAGADASSVREI